jgi:hypothetical protein
MAHAVAVAGDVMATISADIVAFEGQARTPEEIWLSEHRMRVCPEYVKQWNIALDTVIGVRIVAVSFLYKDNFLRSQPPELIDRFEPTYRVMRSTPAGSTEPVPVHAHDGPPLLEIDWEHTMENIRTSERFVQSGPDGAILLRWLEGYLHMEEALHMND